MNSISMISIHAPIVGCDIISSCDFVYISQFQSTHPSWGATCHVYLQKAKALEISIHAPIVGCDRWLAWTGIFQIISIHAPIVGCDIISPSFFILLYISIHAPIVGCDVWCLFNFLALHDFNPRTHRGVRQYASIRKEIHKNISIHAPIVGCDNN